MQRKFTLIIDCFVFFFQQESQTEEKSSSQSDETLSMEIIQEADDFPEILTDKGSNQTIVDKNITRISDIPTASESFKIMRL